MGNNLPHELSVDNMANYSQTLEADEAQQNGSLARRKTSASVNEIRDLYSALQGLVPSQDRPRSTAPYGAIGEETSTYRTYRNRVDMVEKDVASTSSNPSPVPAFTKRHSCHSPLPLKSQPKVVQRKRSNSCFVISATPNSLAPPSPDFLNADRERRSSDSSTEPQTINEELSDLIDNFDKDKKSLTKGDSSEVKKSSSKRRHSGGDLLGERLETFKDPKARMRRRSIGGSLLLNAIIESSSRQDSLTNALNIIARKDELQEVIETCQETSEQEKKNRGIVGEGFDEVDGRPQHQLNQKTSELNVQNSKNEHQDIEGNSSAEKVIDYIQDVKTQAVVGSEMHNLLEALQELVVTGEGTTPPASSQTSSRRTSWVEKSSPKRKESLDELEAFFKNKLDEISEKESDESNSKFVKSQANTETTKNLKIKKMEDAERKFGSDKKRSSSSVDQHTGASSLQKSQSNDDFLSPRRVAKHVARGRRASVQIEMNRMNPGRSNPETPIKEKKVTSRLIKSSSRSRRRKSDIPIIRHNEVFLESTDDEARKRALWKEDQEGFAKQVNQRLQDWLEKATAVSLSTAETTEDESVPQVSIDTNPGSPKEEDTVKTKRAKFAIKKVFRGSVKRSRSLHNLLDPEEIQVEKPKSRSPLIERSKKNLLKLGRLRIPRSKSMHNLAAMKPNVDKVERKSTESDESSESSSCNSRRSTIWYDDDSSPEMIPKVIEIDISAKNLNVDHLSLRRSSCPTPKNNSINSLTVSKSIKRLPIDLPLFYAPGMEPSNMRIQKKVENSRQNTNEKENKMPRVRKPFFPVRKEIKNELFYNEPKGGTRLFPNPLSPPTINELSIPLAKSSGSTTADEVQLLTLQNYDLSNPNVSNDFESFEEFRARTKSTESEDSGCPNTSDC